MSKAHNIEQSPEISPLADIKAKIKAKPDVAILDDLNERDAEIEDAHNAGVLPDAEYERRLKENDQVFAKATELVAA